MPSNLSEDQPIETGAPENPTDVGAEFEAMTNPAPDVPEPEMVGPHDADPVEPEQDAGVEEFTQEAEQPIAQPAADANVLAQMQAEMAILRAQLEQSQSGVKEPTIGEITSPFQARVNEEEVFQNRPFLGLAPGTTPEIEFEQALSSPAAFNGALNRVYQASIRNTLMMLPSILDAHLNHKLAEAEADKSFWDNNGDLKDAEPVVKAIASHMLQQNSNMSKGAFYKALETMVRTHLKRPRAATKSGGTQHLPQRGAPQSGQRRPQPSLAGGTGSRRAAPSSGGNSIADQIEAMRRAT